MKICAHGLPIVGGHDRSSAMENRREGREPRNFDACVRPLIAIESRRMRPCACVAAECRSGIHLWTFVTRMNPPLSITQLCSPSPPPPLARVGGAGAGLLRLTLYSSAKTAAPKLQRVQLLPTCSKSARQLFQRARHHARKRNLRILVP